ncbi:MAG: hypothetical protein WC803_02850 [Sphingomonas sp.]|jgi:hypothetical protein
MRYGIFLSAALMAMAPAQGLAAKRDPAASKPLPASVDGLPIGAIPPQSLPKAGCAAFLWTTGPSAALVAMITADPGQIRFAPGGVMTDLARVAALQGAQAGGALGFAHSAEYAGGDMRLAIDMDIVLRDDVSDGAVVPAGVLRFERDGQDAVIVPVKGLIGCTK